MTSEARFFVPEGVVAREVNGETVLLSLAAGKYFGLDAVGTKILQFVSENKTIDEIVSSMLEIYDVERQRLEVDVQTLIGNLLNEGLLQEA